MVVKKGTIAKKTSTATKKTSKETPVEIVEEVVEKVEEIKAQAPEPTRKTKRLDINRDELIPCRSARPSLIYVSKRTSEKFEWANYGDVHYLTMGELITMKSTQPRFLKDGWLIVDDEEAIEQLGLAKMYGTLFEFDDIDEFFEKSDGEIKRILTNMPSGFKTTIATFARERIQSGELDSNRKIKLLEDLLEVDLKMFE